MMFRKLRVGRFVILIPRRIIPGSCYRGPCSNCRYCGGFSSSGLKKITPLELDLARKMTERRQAMQRRHLRGLGAVAPLQEKGKRKKKEKERKKEKKKRKKEGNYE